MQNHTLRQVTLTLLFSTTLLTSPAISAEFTISGASVEQNGGVANILNGNDILIIEAGGSITHTTLPPILGLGTSNTILNAGSITASGAASVGMFLADSNTITNAGSITTDGDSIHAIFVQNSNTVTNSGVIVTRAINSNGIDGQNNNSFLNSGTITISGNASAGMSGLNNNTIVNSGTITTNGADSFGTLSKGVNNNLSNSGTIIVNGANSFGMGFKVNVEVPPQQPQQPQQEPQQQALIANGTTTLNNSGTIIINSNGSAGIGSGGGNNISVTNSGTITTNGNAHGILVIDDSTVDNSGAITTFGPNGRGIFAGTGNMVTHSGNIVAAKSAAIEFTGSDNQLALNAPAFIGGAIEMGNFNVAEITTGRSHSNLWKFNGNPADVAVSGPVPWAWDAATNQFATLDPTALSAAPDVLADIVSSLSDVSRDKTQANDWWLQGYGNFSSQPTQTIYNDYTHLSGGVAAGAAYVLNENLALGTMVGYQASSLSVNSKWVTSQTIIGKGIVGGIYGSAKMNNFFADFALYGGWSNNRSDRYVNDNLATLGEDHALGNFNTWFLAPELRVGADFEAGEGWVITPSSTLRYATQSVDAYTETGSNANATIGSTMIQVFEGSAELAVSYNAQDFSMTVRGGVNYRQNLSAATRDITLLSQALTLPVLTNTTISPYLGIDAALKINDTSALDLSAKATYLGTGAYAVSASLGFSSQY